MGRRMAAFPGLYWTGPAYLAGTMIGMDHPAGRGANLPVLLLGFLVSTGLVAFVARSARVAAAGGREPPPAEVHKVFGGILLFLLASGYLAASRGLHLLLLTGMAMLGALLFHLPPLSLGRRDSRFVGLVQGLLLLLTVLTPAYLLDGRVPVVALPIGAAMAVGFLVFGRPTTVRPRHGGVGGTKG